jgi:hypothetical protein
MSSNSKKTKAIRARKAKSNKTNLKRGLKRIQRNAEILRDLASSDEN